MLNAETAFFEQYYSERKARVERLPPAERALAAERQLSEALDFIDVFRLYVCLGLQALVHKYRTESPETAASAAGDLGADPEVEPRAAESRVAVALRDDAARDGVRAALPEPGPGPRIWVQPDA